MLGRIAVLQFAEGSTLGLKITVDRMITMWKTMFTNLKLTINRVWAIHVLEMKCKQEVVYSKDLNGKSCLGRGQWWGRGCLRAPAAVIACCLAQMSLPSPYMKLRKLRDFLGAVVIGPSCMPKPSASLSRNEVAGVKRSLCSHCHASWTIREALGSS